MARSRQNRLETLFKATRWAQAEKAPLASRLLGLPAVAMMSAAGPPFSKEGPMEAAATKPPASDSSDQDGDNLFEGLFSKDLDDPDEAKCSSLFVLGFRV
ncbi:unnamed protein product [Symbiodinium sp. CCMP2456]|nr:unnamed protein product [Symbiodinium sp. CCMP2456]